jgi:hypothetical protein
MIDLGEDGCCQAGKHDEIDSIVHIQNDLSSTDR